ncbi:FAD-dependent oxidoreductase [Amycolatopsis granulosa]|uniref:FAD-dependent oxidoreductase n=1 Tax=Amycolatopsis granulosa TaxID=185684 RepID=UPI00141F2478|nr:FAD-dependent oxidoreductase [Amycolatopsis granulosa]NIH83812.1 pyruvate/2-oxoglutarate dehydrogenase complex dihydrolipoamide dehydrogenase (E3) component [Amycolatopsis granulosa]
MTAPALTFDVLVIGFGKGGKTLAATLGRRGRRVAMVEQSDRMYGGTCINIGCVPTKALVHQAEQRRAGDDPGGWYEQAIRGADSLTTLLRGNNLRMLDTLDTVTVITGRARFADPKTVSVRAGDDELRVSADTIVINTGAHPVTGGLPLGGRIMTSTGLLALETLPSRLVIVGGGYVGTEFASMYAQFGSEVTVIDHAPRVLAREDPDVAAAAEEILRGAGITFVNGARVTDARDGTNSAVVTYTSGDTTSTVEAEAVLVALGRAPATRDLGLSAAGVHTTAGGAIAVDDHLRTSQPHIYAIGDVNGGPQFTYVSLDDHRIVLDQLTGDGTRSTADRVAVPSTVFMTPPLARVGLTETEARANGHSVRIASKLVAQIAAMPRARIMSDTRGLIKFVVDATTDHILGAALLCIDAQELVNTVALAMRHGVTATELRDAIYTHPSSTEAFNEVLATLA